MYRPLGGLKISSLSRPGGPPGKKGRQQDPGGNHDEAQDLSHREKARDETDLGVRFPEELEEEPENAVKNKKEREARRRIYDRYRAMRDDSIRKEEEKYWEDADKAYMQLKTQTFELLALWPQE